MSPHAWIKRVGAWTAGGAAVALLGGCSLFKSIQFTNVSEAWLNVRFYAGDPQVGEAGPSELLSRRAYQVAPGESARYTPTRKLVHIQVETVTPTWEPPGVEYWLELMTHPPVHIVATGRPDRLDFQTGSGEVAIIPERERRGERFHYVAAERTNRPPRTAPARVPAQQAAAPEPAAGPGK